MPLIVYQRAHGVTDYPHHFALFEALEERGLLDKYDFVLDSFMDIEYCRLLVRRFPQLLLAIDRSWPRKAIEWLKHYVGRGYRYIASLDKFDAVCESPGGRINPIYSGSISNFWLYPRTPHRAVLFHSLERGILQQPKTRESLAQCDLIITRTDASAQVAEELGARRIVKSCDIVFRRKFSTERRRPGCAIALRLPNLGITEEYLNRVRSIFDWLEQSPLCVDYVRVEDPLGLEQDRRGYSSQKHPHISLYQGDYMYTPFEAVRDAIVSCRLHTTIIGLLYGNLNILQFHVESGSTKLQQFVDDLGLYGLKVHTKDDLTLERVREFLENPQPLDQNQVTAAIELARQKVENGLDALEEWLETF